VLMAERIKLRLTAAKVGVSVALLAAIGGVVDRLRAGPPEVRITPASSPGQFLKLHGISGNVKTALLKLEDKWLKLDTALNSVVHKLGTDYLKLDTANTEFLKIHKADSEFLKIETADGEFLKIDKASAEYLKIDTADAKFTALQKADAQFLKIRTAQNEFIQGRGGVVSAATTAFADGSVRTLLSSPDGKLTVSIQGNSNPVGGASSLIIVVDNETGALLPAVYTADSSPNGPTALNLKPGKTPITLTNLNAPHQLQLQTFGNGNSSSATSLIISSEQSGQGAAVVGQMLIGLL
jgi:hypothetical protein